MTDRVEHAVEAVPAEDRTLPAVIYGLYLLGLLNGLTILLGLILAYVYRDGAGPRMRTHYVFLIRTFWLWIAWFLIGLLLILFGAPLSLVLIGLPFFAVGIVIMSAIHLWFAVRAVIGVIYLARDEAYPRPHSWLL
jgi:uncharacterized membrane protein